MLVVLDLLAMTPRCVRKQVLLVDGFVRICEPWNHLLRGDLTTREVCDLRYFPISPLPVNADFPVTPA